MIELGRQTSPDQLLQDLRPQLLQTALLLSDLAYPLLPAGSLWQQLQFLLAMSASLVLATWGTPASSTLACRCALHELLGTQSRLANAGVARPSYLQDMRFQVLTAAPPLIEAYCQQLDVELGPLGGALQHLLQTVHGMDAMWLHLFDVQSACLILYSAGMYSQGCLSENTHITSSQGVQ